MMFLLLSCLIAGALAQRQGNYQQNDNYQEQHSYQQQPQSYQQQDSYQQQPQNYQQRDSYQQQPRSYQQQDSYQQQPQNYQNNYDIPSTRRPSYAPPAGLLHNQGLDGSYRFAYQTKDGQTRAESTGADGGIKGSYTYTSPEGQKVQVSYTADQYGYHASSDAIPKAPSLASAPAKQNHYREPSSYQDQYQGSSEYQSQGQQSNPPSYPEQTYDYSQHQPRSRGSQSGTPTAQYSFGDPKVLSDLQNLFG